MNPTERLRSVTRRSVDDHALAAETADALAAFAAEPASLVVACRRVLAHHRSHGVLWWVCARVLAAPDAVAASREACRALDADRTADRLAAALPLLDDDERIAVIGWPYAVDVALTERLDLDVVAVRVAGADPGPGLRRRSVERGVRIVDAWGASVLDVARLIVPALAIGNGRALVPAGTTEALGVIGKAASEVWLLSGVGRVLPRRLYEAVERAATTPAEVVPYDVEDGDASLAEVVALESFDRVAGPRGLEPSADADTHPDCPVVPELLRPL